MKREILKAFIWAFAGVIVTIIATYVMGWLSESTPKLEYRIVASNELTKKQLVEVIRKNYKELSLDLSMDDNVILDYHHTILEMRNLGGFIEEDLLFNLDFGKEEIKILDVLCKLTCPIEKEIEAELRRPGLKLQSLNPSENTHKIELTFFHDEPSTFVGLLVYRSSFESVGFGRINPVPITNGVFTERVKRGARHFYAVTALGFAGHESAPFGPLPWPELSFNRPHFENTRTIAAYLPSGEIDFETIQNDFKDTLAQLKKGEKIYICMDRAKFLSKIFPETIDQSPVYFEDDVQFLRGKSTLHVHNVPKKGRLRFDIIWKTYARYNLSNITLSLKRLQDIELVKKENRFSRKTGILRKPLSTENNGNIRLLLTPARVRVFFEEDGLILAWSRPKSAGYSGVRIFRYSEPEYTGQLESDHEIYDGKGISGLMLGFGAGTFRPADRYSGDIVHPSEPYPPPRKGEEARPSSPTGLSVTGGEPNVLVNIEGEELMPYYVDENVSCGQTYTYVVVAYDEVPNYSYAIESVVKWDCNLEYLGGTQVWKEGVQTIVKEFPEYKDDIRLCKILKRYHEKHGNLDQVKQLESVISRLGSGSSNMLDSDR